MTAPLDVPARLSAVAVWDVPLLRRAVGSLTSVVERLPSWRARLEGVARSLEAGESWSGQAARAAVAAVREASTVAWAVDAALTASLAELDRLVVEADPAQERAHEALALAAALPGGPDAALRDADRLAAAVGALVPGAGVLHPAGAAAEAAMGHASAAAVAAEQAGAALAAVGVRDAFAPADFAALAARVPLAHPVCVLPVPSGPPGDVAAWWAALPLTAQLAVIASTPQALGRLDGVPAWARDRANRLVLDRALAHRRLPEPEVATARVVAARIAAEEATGGQVQLHLLDLAGDRVGLALGDLDTADAVALVVPGIFNTPADDLTGLVADAEDVGAATRAAAPATAVATMVWLGYRTPSHPGEAVVRTSAGRGGPALAAALDGLGAARGAVAAPAARTTVVAHSYGTYVVDEAADEPGRLAADAVVLLGSPGMEDDAASLEAPAVFDAATPADPISWAGWFGDGHTWEEGYGSTALPTEASMGHSHYLDPARPTLAAIGEVVAGRRAPE
ncbi:alpha/beta hydrolase [Blastococcus mobilis]|uniref:Alpha/beta hydrolase n=1 Tax=Blastococcus mobilis TaxID=1938746 RepID=A0A238VYA5_9ACTN|nr:alpha/beta hydrolase [Blastococcus mobilis]SNR39151.1 Alpha/beta hydrolase [Blastococcus mobilis]